MKTYNLPIDERPLEKIYNGQLKSIPNAELISIIMGSEDNIDIGRKIIKHYGSYENLREASLRELCQNNKIHKKQAAKIMAALEISRRIQDSFKKGNILLNTPKKIVNFIRPKLFSSHQEILYILFLSNSNHLKGLIEFSRGTDNEIHIYLKELMKTILNGYSSNIVLIHNHIENILKVSSEDINFTKQILERCRYFNLRLLDHYIVSKSHYLSIMDQI